MKDGRSSNAILVLDKALSSIYCAWYLCYFCPADVETALLGLQSVDDCSVSRTAEAGAAGQHVWSVTFLEVKTHLGCYGPYVICSKHIGSDTNRLGALYIVGA